MKTRSKVICLICGALVMLSACQQNPLFLQNTRPTVTEETIQYQQSIVNSAAVLPRFSPNYLEELEYQLEQFSSRFFESTSLPHQPPVR